ncbi:MAG TPA: hypothetical protein ENJ51_04450 [Leucothrix mucor]|uniref:Uncharacterized protein n=1 Tax=Leucothrix mucor TaxID=45248 RepID=A0A7V2WUR4_LEUMU|nr:hypothetical protein [Leucothrix mucor]
MRKTTNIGYPCDHGYILKEPLHRIIGYQLKAGQVTSWQITRILRQAQGTSFLSLSKDTGE